MRLIFFISKLDGKNIIQLDVLNNIVNDIIVIGWYHYTANLKIDIFMEADMNISIDRTDSTPVYLQICSSIRTMIIKGILSKGSCLPPERKLAEKLGVNRSTVLNAYRELKADGFADSHVGRGTVVVYDAQSRPENDAHIPAPMQWRHLFNEAAARYQEPLTRDLLELGNRDDVISFAAGIASPELDLNAGLRLLQGELVEKKGKEILQHTPTEGCYELRENLRRLMAKRDVYTSSEEIMVLSGSQQGLDIAARMLIDPGDLVIVEEPSFFCAIQIFKAAGARVIGVPADDNGMRVDVLEPMLARMKPKLIYTMPTFQNPSGAVMDMERRRRLVELSVRHHIPILEDDAYGELRYDGDRLPPLKSLDRSGSVIYLSTFSKIAFQGLRVGWVVAAPQVIRQFSMVKQMADLHSSSLSQWVVNEFLDRNMFEAHMKVVCGEYSRRRDIMLDALDKYAADGVEWNCPKGGLYIWCKLPEGITMSRVLSKAAALGVAFVPGEFFAAGGQCQNFLRLNFTYSRPDRINEGIKRLMKAVEEAAAESGNRRSAHGYDIRPIL